MLYLCTNKAYVERVTNDHGDVESEPHKVVGPRLALYDFQRCFNLVPRYEETTLIPRLGLNTHC
jgi:hypothetical protein